MQRIKESIAYYIRKPREKSIIIAFDNEMYTESFEWSVTFDSLDADFLELGDVKKVCYRHILLFQNHYKPIKSKYIDTHYEYTVNILMLRIERYIKKTILFKYKPNIADENINAEDS